MGCVIGPSLASYPKYLIHICNMFGARPLWSSDATANLGSGDTMFHPPLVLHRGPCHYILKNTPFHYHGSTTQSAMHGGFALRTWV